MVTDNGFIGLLACLSALTPSLIQASVFSKQAATLTFYYDVGEVATCGKNEADPVLVGWSQNINGGTTYCEQQRGFSLNQIGSNAVVAFDQDKVWADPAAWCGRGVKLYGPDGQEVTSPDGPLYIWDSCQNCAGGGAVLDVSASVFVEAKGGTCGGNNPTGFTYEVLDTYVVDPSIGLHGAPGGAVPSQPLTQPGFGGTSAPGGGAGGYPSTSFGAGPGVGYSPSTEQPPANPATSAIPPVPTQQPVAPTTPVAPTAPANPATQVPPPPPVDPATQAPPANPATQAPPVAPSVGPPTQPSHPAGQPAAYGGWGGYGWGHNKAVAAIADSTGPVAGQCKRRTKRRLSKSH